MFRNHNLATPICVLHWQLSEFVAVVVGIETDAQPHEVHCSFLKPSANGPTEHGMENLP
jgi:hypothetical protein